MLPHNFASSYTGDFLTHLSPLHKRGCFFSGSQKGIKIAETLVSISAHRLFRGRFIVFLLFLFCSSSWNYFSDAGNSGLCSIGDSSSKLLDTLPLFISLCDFLSLHLCFMSFSFGKYPLTFANDFLCDVAE